MGLVMKMPASLRSYLNEPAIPNPPGRVWRDWALIAGASITTVLEATLRTDEEWTSVSVGWRIGAVVAFFVAAPPALLMRRTRPLLATLWGFIPTIAFGVAVALVEGFFGGVTSTAVILVVPYALYRWGSGRDGSIGAGVLLMAGIVGNLSDPTTVLSEWIGGFIVLSIPVEAGFIVRYRNAARLRAIDEVKSRERIDIARELHDTVAHHVSAIAVQAQAGRAIASTDPERAIEVLGVIEQAASRTLAEMRAMVGSLRGSGGNGAEMTPQRGLADLAALAQAVPGPVRIDVDVDRSMDEVGETVEAAVFRIVQESITNAVRHAKNAHVVVVKVAPAGDGLRLTVSDDGQSGPGDSRGDGYGLLGMAERVNLLGGQFSAGPRAVGGWEVVADLPRTVSR